MKEDDVLPAATATNQKKDSSDSVLFGRGRYKFFAFAALMLLAFWSMFTGTVTLRLSTEDLNRLSEDIGIPTNHESLDVLVLTLLLLPLCLILFCRDFEAEFVGFVGNGGEGESGEAYVGCVY